MSEVTLTQSTRVNLLALQKNTALIDRTSLRLSTGKRVNAPAENVRAFVLAKALTDQAGDLLSVKGPIGATLTRPSAPMGGTTPSTITRPPELCSVLFDDSRRRPS